MRGRNVLAVLAALLVSLAVWAMPVSAYADTLSVGDGQTYATLDEAVGAAKDGDVIELYGDATSSGISLYDNLTIQAAEGLSIKPTITFIQYGIAMNYGANNDIELTFRNVDIVMSGIGSTPAKGEWNWMTICASGNADLTLDNVNMTMDATGVANNPHAIYFTGDNVLEIINGSNLTIKNYPQDAVEWDGGTGGYFFNIADSTFCSDHNRSGITGTFYVTADNADIDVINSTGNGSNGSHFVLTDSNVDFSDNGSHGLSAGKLTADNSTITARDNGYCGVVVANDVEIRNGTEITVTGNAWRDDSVNAAYAGFHLNGGSTSNTYDIDGTTSLTIVDNYNTGLDVRRGTLTIANGAKVTVTGNSVTNTDMAGYGGGLYIGFSTNSDWAKATIPADAVICNNHALVGGDDIYVATGAEGSRSSLTISPVAGGQFLDGTRLVSSGTEESLGSVEDDCTEAIDGWYLDGINQDGELDESIRWEAHAGDPSGNIVELYRISDTTTVEGPIALKAAHGITATVTPADITIYMGGTEGYESVITGEQGTADVVGTESDSLPEPGFYIALPECINEALKAEVGDTPGAVDLSDRITFRTATDDPVDQREWHFEMYGATASVAYERFVYRLVPAAGQDPIRLQFTSGDQFFTSDDFDPATIGRLNNQYTMGVYPGDVDQNNIVMDIEVGGRTYTYTVEVDTATLNIRYVTGEQADVVTDVVSDIADAPDAGERAYAVLPDSTRYTINQSDIDIDVTEDAAPSLLFDDVVSDENTAGAQNYDEHLRDRAVEVATQNGAALESVGYEAKYLDLVDANNGNVWLQASEPVTVYWPYPEGTDQNTEFHLVHFEGLNRELANGEIAGGIANAPTSYIEVENTEHGIRFTTDGFSPFVLMWDASEEPAPMPDEPVTKPEQPAPGETLTATGDSTPVLIAGIAAAGAACVAISFAVRKHGKA